MLESWQGRGVGKALTRGLADRAGEEGITRFTALMLAHNSPMRHLLAELGPTRVLSHEAGAVELAVDLSHESADRALLVSSSTGGGRR